jgi:hypothetical protein
MARKPSGEASGEKRKGVVIVRRDAHPSAKACLALGWIVLPSSHGYGAQTVRNEPPTESPRSARLIKIESTLLQFPSPLTSHSAGSYEPPTESPRSARLIKIESTLFTE